MIIFFISLVRIARCMNGERQAEGILWFRMPDMIAYPVKIAVMICDLGFLYLNLWEVRKITVCGSLSADAFIYDRKQRK